MNILFTFKTFADVFLCEKIGNAAGLSCRVVPVHRSLDISCEYAVEIINGDQTSFYTMLEHLNKNNVEYIRVFHSISTENGEIY